MRNQKHCCVCGRGDHQHILTLEDENNGLRESDVKLKHCQSCGACVCGFCEHLGVCCDLEDE